MRTCLALLIAALGASPQGTPTKAKASDYPVHTVVGGVEVGAEYMVRLIQYERASFITEDYLVVEVALFPSSVREFSVNARQFTLRVNGKKTRLMAQTPGMVAASIKYPDWERPQSTATAQAGDAGVILGGPSVGRFPGDRRPPASTIPRLPRAPEDETKPQTEPTNYTEVVTRSALPEGPRKTSVSGYLFFPWRGRLTKIKSVELLIQPDSGDPVALRLR